MDEPLSPRQFLRRYNLPQLVRIHDAHLHQLNASRGSMGAGNSAEQTHKRHQPPQQELMKAITSKGSSGLATIKSSLDSTGTNTTGSESSSNSRTKSCSISRGNPLGVFPVKLNNLRPTSEVQFEPSTSSSSHRHSCFGLKSPEEEGEQQQQQQQPDEDKLLDLDQPFLLYEAYSSRQIIAYSLDISSSSPMSTTSATTNTSGPTNIDLRASKRVGPALLIPESYSGWFSLVTRGGQTAGYFTTVDELVRAQVPYFMTREDLEAHLLFKETTVYANGTQKPSVTTTNNSCGSLIVKSGTVLRCLGVYEDISPVILGLDKSKKATLRAKKEVLFAIEPVNRYLKCIAYTGGPSGGQMVFVSLSTTGKFYLIAKANSKSLSYNCVYSMKHLMHMVRLPTTVHLVVGPKPKNYLPSASSSTILYNSSTNLNGSSSKKKDSNEGDVTMFSATLYLEEIRVRDVILACTLSSDPFTNLSNNSETTNNVLTTGKSRTNSITASFKRSLRGSRFLRKLKADVPTLLEFDLDASFNFIRTFIDSASGSGNKFGGTLSSRKLPELVLQRLRYCQAEAELWRQQIKISHDITPKRYMYRSLQHLSQSSSSGQHQWQVEHQEPQQHHQLFRERDCPTPPKPPARHRRERCNRILEEDNQKIQDLTS